MRKQLTIIAAAFLAAIGFNSCSSDYDDEKTNGGNSSDNNETIIEDIVAERAAKSAIEARFTSVTSMSSAPLIGPTIKQVPYTWENDVDIIERFPEFVKPEGVYHNFVYYSTGEPFTVVMLYSNGGYRHRCGIYWYDEDGECHEQEFWNELDETFRTWYNANGSKTDIISRQSDQAGAYTIQLPKGTKFGFYQQSFWQSSNDVWDPVTIKATVDPKTGEQSYPYKFYTEYVKNWNYPLTGEGQAMSTDINGWTIVGFEDVSLTYPSCDTDYNDCVFAINPVQNTNAAPEPEIIDGSVETNLSVSEENGEDKVKFSLHVRAVTDVEVIIPVVDEALADDFAIVAKHDKEYAYAEQLTIAGQPVTLSYSTTSEGYLKITTQGINQQVIDYCNSTYADGLTFECNLFFSKFYLQGSPTITFTHQPTFYITSCVTDSPEAEDIEVVWADKTAKNISALDFQTTGGALDYAHKVYSLYSEEELKKMGWIK